MTSHLCAYDSLSPLLMPRSESPLLLPPLLSYRPCLCTALLQYNPCFCPCTVSQYRWNRFKALKHAIEENEGGFDKFSQGESCYREACRLG